MAIFNILDIMEKSNLFSILSVSKKDDDNNKKRS